MSGGEEIDETVLNRLRELGGEDLVNKMIDLFLDYVPQRLEAARSAERQGDLKAVEHAVHSFKSGAGNVGARGLFDLAQRIENLAAERNRDAIGPLLSELEQNFSVVQSRLQRKRSGRNS